MVVLVEGFSEIKVDHVNIFSIFHFCEDVIIMVLELGEAQSALSKPCWELFMRLFVSM